MTKLSVIICTYNRDKYILDALNSLKGQTSSYELFEILVVNNNCTDNTEKICKDFAKNNPDINFVHVFETNQGLSYARNTGIEKAKSPLISFIDDDAIASSDYVNNLINCFNDYPDFDAIGGKVIPIYPNDVEPLWMFKHVEGIVSKVDYGENFEEFKKKYPAGCNMAFRKNLFKQIGMFNTDLELRSDDKYIFSILKRYKKKVLYAPNIIVKHNIEQYRLEYKFIKKLSRLNGYSERIRLKKGYKINILFKFFDYVLKVGISLLLLLIYFFKGQGIKGKYLLTIMWFSLFGFVFYKKKIII